MSILHYLGEEADPLRPDCIHAPHGGLCPDCQGEYDTDPEAWYEFGDHPEGIERTRELEAEMARWRAEASEDPIDWTDIPF